jgi:mannosylglycoprotein endo-beta-mannosidase
MRGQMYDYYLDPNACLYGLRKGSEPLHIMMNPVDSMVTVVNNGFSNYNNLMVQAKAYDMDGKDYFYSQVFNSIGPSSVRRFFPLNDFLKKLNKKDGVFVSLRILNQKQEILSDNFYWLPANDGEYTGLQKIKSTSLKVEAVEKAKGKIEVKLSNAVGNPVAFFNRIALIDSKTGKRVLPSFYDDNYVSVLPGESKTVTVEFSGNQKNAIEVYGWNVDAKRIEIN